MASWRWVRIVARLEGASVAGNLGGGERRTATKPSLTLSEVRTFLVKAAAVYAYLDPSKGPLPAVKPVYRDAVPTAATANPPMAGPTTRPSCMLRLVSELALGRSSSGTNVGTTAK